MIRLGKRISKVQLFIVKSQVFDGYVTLFQDQFHYLTRVRRLKVGEKMDFVVENQTRLTVSVTSIQDPSVFFDLISEDHVKSDSPVSVTLVQCCPKQDKLSEIIDSCTQAGLSALIPVLSARSIVDYSPSKQEQKVQRWKTIAADASRQSQRSTVLDLSPILTFQEFATIGDSHQWDLKLVCWEEATVSLRSVLDAFQAQANPVRVCLVIGPEGGLTAQEVQTLCAKGFLSVSLGSSILRTENAGFFALAQVLYHFS